MAHRRPDQQPLARDFAGGIGASAARDYVKLVTEDGLLCTTYRDMSNDAWYLDRIYD